MNRTVTMQYPIMLMVEEDSEMVRAYAFDVPSAGVEYGSAAGAVKKMRRRVKMLVADAVRFSAPEYGRQLVIGTKDGTVLVVRHRFGFWRYEICWPGRQTSCCTAGRDTSEAATADARKHAEGCGGVAWECLMV